MFRGNSLPCKYSVDQERVMDIGQDQVVAASEDERPSVIAIRLLDKKETTGLSGASTT